MRWVVCIALALAACQSTGKRGVGFLSDYGRLEQSPRYPNTRIWVKPGIALYQYDRVIVEPVQVLPKPGSAAEQLTPEVQKKVAEAFRFILNDNLEPFYTLAQRPGPHTLRIRVALTEVRPAKISAQGDSPVEVGAAAMELQALDAATGEILGEVTDRIEGSTRGRDVAPKWKNVEGAFVEWAKRLVDYLNSFKPKPGEVA